MRTPRGDGTNWLIVYYSVTVATNLLTTFLIIFRILSVGGIKTMRTYRGIIEVLVESAFLYSATYAVYLASAVHDAYAAPAFHDSNWYLTALLNAATVSFHLVLRVLVDLMICVDSGSGTDDDYRAYYGRNNTSRGPTNTHLYTKHRRWRSFC